MVCTDGQSHQCLGEKREPVPMKPGKTAKEEYAHVREGICSIFMFTEPRHAHASEHRNKRDWILRIRALLEVHYSDAPKVKLVMDSLNTHSVSSLKVPGIKAIGRIVINERKRENVWTERKKKSRVA
ncbi:MAG: transposase [Clostridiales Family XIII bacterium]|jgi:hypothetical protein|nr:transposase [Clostridiales Family XIII bacterium]